jgi:hypoxanthine-DNA glycosylase
MKTALLPLIHGDSEILILGTMPGEKAIAQQEYYANKGNHFWKILFAVFNVPFSEDYERRRELLKQHKIALWEVLATCDRTGSLDHTIKNEVPNNFDELLSVYPIRCICFDSKSAANFYDKYFSRRADIRYYQFPSPSGVNAHLTLDEKIAQWRVLKSL